MCFLALLSMYVAHSYFSGKVIRSERAKPKTLMVLPYTNSNPGVIVISNSTFYSISDSSGTLTRIPDDGKGNGIVLPGETNRIEK